MQTFYSVLEKNEMEFHRITLDEKGQLGSCSEDTDRMVFVYEKEEDIEKLCRRQEQVLEKATGRPVRIRHQKYIAVFIWNKTFGVVLRNPVSEEGWIRYFKMDPNASCAICMEYKPKRTICGNCTVVICSDCRSHIKKATCPCCTVKVDLMKV